MSKTQRTIRLLILLLLIESVYFESGVWTAIVSVVVFVWLEYNEYRMARYGALNTMLLSAYEPQAGEDRE